MFGSSHSATSQILEQDWRSWFLVFIVLVESEIDGIIKIVTFVLQYILPRLIGIVKGKVEKISEYSLD